MHPEQIKAAMRMRGVTPSALADRLEVSPATVSQVITGRTRSRRIMAAIADVTGTKVDVLWPPKASVLRRSGKELARRQHAQGGAA